MWFWVMVGIEFWGIVMLWNCIFSGLVFVFVWVGVRVNVISRVVRL